MSEVKRIYDPELAGQLDHELNNYFEDDSGEACNGCLHTSHSEYENTGFVNDDGKGMFVEKKCKRCGTITEDGDGDFHQFYDIIDGEVINKED